MIQFLYRLLEIPLVYEIVVRVLAPGGMMFRRIIDRQIFTRPVYRVLDVGCGPDPISPKPAGILVGVDINEAYILKYTRGFIDQDPQLIFNPPASRERLGYVVSSENLPFADNSFDEVRASSFFHHLTDEEAEKSVQEMVRCTQPGGRLVMFDAVWPRNPWTRPFAYIILRFDRGRHMRTEKQLVGVFQRACPGKWEWKRHTYTLNGMELLCLQHIKE